jgi:hypothetical protein
VGDSRVATFQQLTVSAVDAAEDGRVQFVGCALAGEGGIPGVVNGAAFVLGSLDEDLCDLEVAYLGQCEPRSEGQFAVGGEARLLAWTRHDQESRSFFCVDTVENARSAALDEAGCPAGAVVACRSSTSSFCRPSAVMLDGEVFAATQVLSPSADLQCTLRGAQVAVTGQPAGLSRTLLLRTGPAAPAAGFIAAVGVGLAGTVDSLLRVTGVCLGGTCPEQAPFELVVAPGESLVPMPQPIFDASWVGTGEGITPDNAAKSNRTIAPTATGWAATVFSYGTGDEGIAVRTGAAPVTEPQIRFPFGTQPPLTLVGLESVSPGLEEGSYLVAGQATGSVPGVDCEMCGLAFGLVVRLAETSESLEGAIRFRPSQPESCSSASATSARYLDNDGTVIVGGNYVCGPLAIDGLDAELPAAGPFGVGFLYKTRPR